jgi:two-component system, LytTR family, response regulator LytT
MKNILVVEDELIIAESIVEVLEEAGYRNVIVVASVKLAVLAIEKEKPDLVFTDIALSGAETGIDLGHLLYEKYRIPFIYITSHSSSHIIHEAKHTFPNAFLTKPFKKQDLLVALELAFYAESSKKESDDQFLTIKDGHEIAQVPISDIMYLKAEKNYTSIHLYSGKKRLVRYVIADVLSQLPDTSFFRIHKSYVVNSKYITSFQSTKLFLNEIVLPVGRSYRDSVSLLF